MKISFSLLLVLVTLSSTVTQVIRPQFGMGRTNTLTTFVTTTASTASTTVVTTRSVCASLVDPMATTPCRRKRQFWNVPLFFALGHHQDDALQFQPLNPSQVLRVESSAVPEYRYRPSSYMRPFSAQQPFDSPLAVQPSFDKIQSVSFRVADPFFGAVKFSALSAIYAKILNSILTPAITVTSTTTEFPTTTTITSFTETVTLTINQAACVPAGLNVCPAAPTPAPTPATTTTPTTAPTTGPTTGPSSTTTGATTSAPVVNGTNFFK